MEAQLLSETFYDYLDAHDCYEIFQTLRAIEERELVARMNELGFIVLYKGASE